MCLDFYFWNQSELIIMFVMVLYLRELFTLQTMLLNGTMNYEAYDWNKFE